LIVLLLLAWTSVALAFIHERRPSLGLRRAAMSSAWAVPVWVLANLAIVTAARPGGWF
jgi:hypothetical protein